MIEDYYTIVIIHLWSCMRSSSSLVHLCVICMWFWLCLIAVIVLVDREIFQVTYDAKKIHMRWLLIWILLYVFLMTAIKPLWDFIWLSTPSFASDDGTEWWHWMESHNGSMTAMISILLLGSLLLFGFLVASSHQWMNFTNISTIY